MRCLVAFVLGLALLVSPLSVSARDGEQGVTSETAPEEPALQPELDADSTEVVPSATWPGYPKVDVRRARIGVGVSLISFAGGVAMMGVAFANIEW